MGLVFFVAILILLCFYFRKVFLHYKLLRIIHDGELKNEDYFLSLLMDNSFFSLKVKCIELNPIEDFFQEKILIELKNKINVAVKILRWSIVLFLSISLIYQVL